MNTPGPPLSRFSKRLISLHQGRGILQLLIFSIIRNKRVYSRLEKGNVRVSWEFGGPQGDHGGLVGFGVS